MNGDILESECEVLVNPVNCVGVMGAGLAKQFKARFPLMFAQYRQDCLNHRLSKGRSYIYPVDGGKKIANLTTKGDWREQSALTCIKDGLQDLASQMQQQGLHSVAVPAIGCGLGGLRWADVRPEISRWLGRPGLTVEVYAPPDRTSAKNRP